MNKTQKFFLPTLVLIIAFLGFPNFRNQIINFTVNLTSPDIRISYPPNQDIRLWSGKIEATANSLNVDGKNYYQDSEFFVSIDTGKPISLILDDNSLLVDQVIIYYNDNNPRVCWYIDGTSDWERVSWNFYDNVTITP